MLKLLAVLALSILGAEAHGYGNMRGGYGSWGMGGRSRGYVGLGDYGGHGIYSGRGGYGGYGGGHGGKRFGGSRYKRGTDEYDYSSHSTPAVYADVHSHGQAVNYAPAVYTDVNLGHALVKHTPEIKHNVQYVDVLPTHGYTVHQAHGQAENALAVYTNVNNGHAIANQHDNHVVYSNNDHDVHYAPTMYNIDDKSYGHGEYVFSGRHSPVTAGHYIGYGNKYDFRHGYPYGYGEMLGFTSPVGNSLKSGYNKLVTKQPYKYSYHHGYVPLTPVHYKNQQVQHVQDKHVKH